MEFQRFPQARVYSFNDQQKWDDKGIGRVSVEYLERSEAAALIVADEDSNTTLFVHRIRADDIYSRPQDTIISWKDPEIATDLALSFEEINGCAHIWDHICDVRRSYQFPAVGGLDVGPRSANEALEHFGSSQGNDGVSHEIVELPPVELSTLPQIAKILTDSLDRDQIASLIVKDNGFFPKLADLFLICEDVENIESLHLLFKIAKAMVSLNEGQIFDVIFSDKYIMQIVGMLEYDPDVASRRNHRSFLKEQVVFKEAVPIPDPALLAKIHQTYRIGYIKDVVLPNVLDNPTVTSINSMILHNNVTVISALLDHSTFVKSFFTELKSASLSEQAKKDLVHFLQEFCSLSKSLQQPPLRSLLFSSFVQEGLFEVVFELLRSTDECLRLRGADILIIVLNYDPSLLRKFLIHQSGHTLFSLLVTGMLTPGQGGLEVQLLEILRMLLDCEATERVNMITTDVLPLLTTPEKISFLEVFYGKYMDQIMKVLISGTSKKSNDLSRKADSSSNKIVTGEILGNICELLCFCVQHHSYRIKQYVMKNQVIEKILQLTARRERHLVVAAVRFLRTCIGRKDDFYNRYVVKNDLFGPVVQAFLANGNRYNLLNSAVLELFKFVYDLENGKLLIVYFIEKYYDKFENILYVDVFKKLKTRYDQVSEGIITRAQDSGAVGSRDKGMSSCARLDGYPDPRRRKDERALDKDEEEYFNEDSDDEEDTASAQRTITTGKPAQAVIVNGGALRGTFGLVDYDDEDEDMPIPMRNNGNEEIHFSAAALGAGSKESLWLDREEEKIFQNVKRKPLTIEIRERDVDLSKRRKAHPEASCSNEQVERLSVEETGVLDKSNSTRLHESKGNFLREEGRNAVRGTSIKVTAESSGALSPDNMNKGAETRAAMNGPNLVKAHGAAGS